MENMDKIITKERIDRLSVLRREMREAALRDAKDSVTPEAVEEILSLLDLYDERMVLWFARLYDPDIGGFYYSNTARDTKVFLPDIESTRQSLNFFAVSGLIPSENLNIMSGLPEVIKNKVVDFTLSLQDEDGFFYHPQWGKKIYPARRGRDFDWARTILTHAGVSPKYPYATEKNPSSGKTKLPDYLQSPEAFKEELAKKDLSKNSYREGHWVASQATLIKAAGDEYVDIIKKWFCDSIRPDNGLWQETVNYDSVNGLMKLSAACTELGVPLPYSDKSIESAIKAALSDEKITFCCEFYNPWCAINSVVKLAKLVGREDELARLHEILREYSPALVRRTKEKIMCCRRDEGVFSYATTCTIEFSQGAYVSVKGAVEGDVNATTISCTGTVHSMLSALGIPKIPIFTKEDGRLLLDIMMNAPSIKKIYENPYGDSLPYPKVLDNK